MDYVHIFAIFRGVTLGEFRNDFVVSVTEMAPRNWNCLQRKNISQKNGRMLKSHLTWTHRCMAHLCVYVQWTYILEGNFWVQFKTYQKFMVVAEKCLTHNCVLGKTNIHSPCRQQYSLADNWWRCFSVLNFSLGSTIIW